MYDLFNWIKIIKKIPTFSTQTKSTFMAVCPSDHQQSTFVEKSVIKQ